MTVRNCSGCPNFKAGATRTEQVITWFLTRKMAASVPTYYQCSLCKILFKDFAAVSTHACSKMQTKTQRAIEESTSQITNCSGVNNARKEQRQQHQTRNAISQPSNISETLASSSGHNQSRRLVLVNSDALSADKSPQVIRYGSSLPNGTTAGKIKSQMGELSS